MKSQLRNEFTIVLGKIKIEKSRAKNLFDLADRSLWNSLEYGKPDKILELVQNYEALRHKDEILDDAVRYSTDIMTNFDLIFKGGASENLKVVYDKFCACAKEAEDSDVNHFIINHPPRDWSFVKTEEKITQQMLPMYIRQYMKINRVPQSIVEKVEKKIPIPEAEAPMASIGRPDIHPMRSQSHPVTVPKF